MQHFMFAKMEGAGNDFVIVDNRLHPVPEFAKVKLVRDLCRRAQGIGADGMVFLENDPDYDFAWDFYNADGSRAEMCGNASRCVARFAHIFGLVDEREMVFRTAAGPIRAELTAAGARVRLPDVAPAKLFKGVSAGPAGPAFDAYLVNTGVPHAVVPVQDLGKIDVANWGRALRRHECFGPAGANVDFMARSSQYGLAIRTYERGVEGETLACGTGATAAALIGADVYKLKTPISVETRGGPILTISFDADPDGGAGEIWLEGPATLVFVGKTFWPNEGRENDFLELMMELED